MSDQESKALKYAFRILAIRPRSVFEMKEKLRARKYSQKIIDGLIKKLKEQDLLNDEKFTREWIKNQLEYRPCGRILIKKKLFEKRIKQEIMEKVLEEMVSPEKELALARKVLQKKRDRLENLSRGKLFQKLSLYLSGKGFSYQVIREVLEETES